MGINIDEHYVSLDGLNYELTNSVSISNRTREAYKDALKELVDCQIIKAYDCNGSNFVINPANSYFNSRDCYFTIIYKDEILKIMNSKISGCDKFKLLKYFVAIISSFQFNNKIPDTNNHMIMGKIPINTLAIKTNNSVATVSKYNKILESLGLIYIYKEYKMTNVYCRPMNKDIVISYYGKPRKKV
jgi:DNA-binding Lrp family transcriptional regulator